MREVCRCECQESEAPSCNRWRLQPAQPKPQCEEQERKAPTKSHKSVAEKNIVRCQQKPKGDPILTRVCLPQEKPGREWKAQQPNSKDQFSGNEWWKNTPELAHQKICADVRPQSPLRGIILSEIEIRVVQPGQHEAARQMVRIIEERGEWNSPNGQQNRRRDHDEQNNPEQIPLRKWRGLAGQRFIHAIGFVQPSYDGR